MFDEKEPSLLEDLAQREEENDSIPEEQKIVKMKKAVADKPRQSE